MDDLLLDPQIRVWVVVPIILITLFVGLGRHFVNQLIQSPKPTTVEKIGDAYDACRNTARPPVPCHSHPFIQLVPRARSSHNHHGAVSPSVPAF